MKTICLIVAAALMAVAAGSPPALAQTVYVPDYYGRIENRSSPAGDCQYDNYYCIANAAVGGSLRAMSNASSMGCNPTAEAGIFVRYTPTGSGDIEVWLAESISTACRPAVFRGRRRWSC